MKAEKLVEPGGVGVSVGGDVHALSPGGIDFRDHFRHASPVGFARDLEVPDFDRNVALAPDAQGFIDGGQDAVALVAHVRGVDAAEFRRLGGQRDQLLGLRVRRGRIFAARSRRRQRRPASPARTSSRIWSSCAGVGCLSPSPSTMRRT